MGLHLAKPFGDGASDTLGTAGHDRDSAFERLICPAHVPLQFT